MADSSQFDQLANRLRRLSLDGPANQDAIGQIMEMNLEELQECRIDFGKAHLNKQFKEMTGELKYLTWFAETYGSSQKISHVKFLRFIELHLNKIENQMNHASSKAKAKPKAKAMGTNVPRAQDRPEIPHDPWHPSSDEEELESVPWEPVTHGEEMNQMNNRMSEMESALQQILNHLNSSAQRPDMA